MHFKVTVHDSMFANLFEARLSEDHVKALSRANELKPFIKTIKQVAPGTGNTGDNLEYDATYDGHTCSWKAFRTLMNSIDIYEDLS